MKHKKQIPAKPSSVSPWMFLTVIIVIGFLAIAAGNAFLLQSAGPSDTGNNDPQNVVQPSGAGLQQVSVRALSNGTYDKPQITVKAGVPVQFNFSAEANAGCGRQLVIPEYGVNMVSKNGETQSATFTPKAPGTISFHCGMNMWRGQITVL